MRLLVGIPHADVSDEWFERRVIILHDHMYGRVFLTAFAPRFRFAPSTKEFIVGIHDLAPFAVIVAVSSLKEITIHHKSCSESRARSMPAPEAGTRGITGHLSEPMTLRHGFVV
jgi:hypothetical protein